MSMLGILRVAFPLFNELSNSLVNIKDPREMIRSLFPEYRFYFSFRKDSLTKLFFYRRKKEENVRLTFNPRFQGDASRK